MALNKTKENIQRILRGATRIVSEGELKAKIEKGKPLRIKLGVDPTAPDIHLGHTVVLNKLRVFQDLGHTVVFIIGDFTAAIGDPSGRDATRPPLSEAEIKENTKTYTEQVFKILDKAKTEVRYNSEWLYPLFDRKNPHFLPKTLLRQVTVQQLMERDDFTERKKAGLPITLLELMYPLFQGYDSVAVKADVELGGNDQIFNLLMGRQLQKNNGQAPQVALTFPLLEGLDGKRKMSKSYGNHIGINEKPEDMFGKVMSISDELMLKYYEVLTEEDLKSVTKKHPKEAKQYLAGLITARFHGQKKADEAQQNFENIFAKRNNPDEMEEFPVPAQAVDAIDLIVRAKMAASKKEARRLVAQGGVQLGGKKLSIGEKISVSTPIVLKVGKRRFKKLIPS